MKTSLRSISRGVRGRPSRKIVLLQISLFAGALVFVICAGRFPGQVRGQHVNEAKPNPCLEGLASVLATPDAAFPAGIVQFYLDDGAVSEPRIATLSFDWSTERSRLRILKCNDGRMETAFALEEPPGEDWDELESFPAIYPVGVVIWGALEEARSSLTIVCYTGSFTYLPSGERVEKKGHFKIAFQGYSARLVDLDLDGVPEVIANIDSEMPEVWTLVDATYVKVGAFPLAQLRSRVVCNAIEAARKKRVAPRPAQK